LITRVTLGLTSRRWKDEKRVELFVASSRQADVFLQNVRTRRNCELWYFVS